MRGALLRGGLAALAAVTLAAGLSAAPLKGKAAPDFTGVTAEGKKITLSQFRGKTAVLLNFYSNACPACDDEFPHLRDLDRKYRSQGVQIVAVNMERSRNEAMIFPRNYGTEFPIVVNGTPIAERYQVQPIPANFLIDKDGRVVQVIEGFNAQELEDAVRGLAGKPRAPKDQKIL